MSSTSMSYHLSIVEMVAEDTILKELNDISYISARSYAGSGGVLQRSILITVSNIEVDLDFALIIGALIGQVISVVLSNQ